MCNNRLCARITERLPKILKSITRNTESTVDGLRALIEHMHQMLVVNRLHMLNAIKVLAFAALAGK